MNQTAEVTDPPEDDPLWALVREEERARRLERSPFLAKQHFRALRAAALLEGAERLPAVLALYGGEVGRRGSVVNRGSSKNGK